MRADKKDARISAEITKRELTRKYEAVAIFAPVEVEVALLQSGCNRKFSQTKPHCKAGQGILRSASAAGIAKANEIKQKGEETSVSDICCQNRRAAFEKGYKGS